MLNRYWFPLLLTGACIPVAEAAQVRGEPAAVAAAERLLQHAGGRAAWANARTFYVEERVFLQSGEEAQLKIWRDLDTGNRRLERTWPGGRYAEWLSASGGFEVRGGAVSGYSPEDLAIELQGLRQEPYAAYRRLARRDPALRVRLGGRNMLYVHDRDEHLLCWFVLDDKGRNISWGNFWNGSINQHYYGPTVDMGDVSLPRWGVSTTGNFRFEYVAGRMTEDTVQPPPR
jgi:hypothetical protein